MKSACGLGSNGGMDNNLVILSRYLGALKRTFWNKRTFIHAESCADLQLRISTENRQTPGHRCCREDPQLAPRS